MNEIAITASLMRFSVYQKILASWTGPTPSTRPAMIAAMKHPVPVADSQLRSEEHTSELQSRLHLVCRLLLEKKKNEQALSLDKLSGRRLRHRRPHQV